MSDREPKAACATPGKAAQAIPPGEENRWRHFLAWVLGGIRRKIMVAVCLLVFAPLLLAYYSSRAVVAERVYTSRIPFTVFDYGADAAPVEAIVEKVMADVSAELLADPERFQEAQHWQRLSSGRTVRQRFVSVVISDDLHYATTTHEAAVGEFLAAAAEAYPDLGFSAGDPVLERNSLQIDESSIDHNVRMSLWSGLSFYVAGLGFLGIAALQSRLVFA